MERGADAAYPPKMSRNYSNSVFIGNLTYDTTPEDLRQLFGEVGHVVRADIITSRGHHRGMGTVEYTNAQDVDEAIRRFNGMDFMHRELFVRRDNPPPVGERRERRGPGPLPRRTHPGGFEIFVANLPYSISWQTLKDMFKECSEVIHADVSVDADGYSRGFGTVYVTTRENQIAAIERWNGYELEGRILEVREGKGTDVGSAGRGDSYVPKQIPSYDYDGEYRGTEVRAELPHSENASVSVSGKASPEYEQYTPSDVEFTSKAAPGGAKNRIIYCENMPLATAESDLYDLFETAGKVLRANLQYDSEGNPTGSSVCEFETVADAQECIERLNNYHYGGCDLKMSYASYA